MLNEAEKNCSRYEQQNKFLKEDIRRLQRSVERHDEIQNLEYLKNIIIKVCFNYETLINVCDINIMIFT